MKLAKMSMVAALLLGANAYAIENVKVSGDAKLYYSTDDGEQNIDASDTTSTTGGLFNKHSSAAQAALNLNVTADLMENVSTGVTFTALSTLGLENNLVASTWEPQSAAFASDYWFSEAWVATKMGETTAKLGRQTLDTPLLFTETWSIVGNTFESVVLINQDLPDTTLVGAYVGTSNGGAGAGNGTFAGVVAAPVQGNEDSRYAQMFGLGNGAYAIGAVNNSMKELTAQAWYYTGVSTANALWLSADLNMDGILAGAQYSALNLSDATAAGLGLPAGETDGDVMAVMLGYEMKDVATFKVAYSQTDDTVGAGGNLDGTGQSKLYTEMWWNYGTITNPDTSTILVSAETTVSDIELFASYVMADDGSVANNDVNELAITATKSYGPLDTTVVFMNMDKNGQGALSAYTQTAALGQTSAAENMLQVYLTLNF